MLFFNAKSEKFIIILKRLRLIRDIQNENISLADSEDNGDFEN